MNTKERWEFPTWVWPLVWPAFKLCWMLDIFFFLLLCFEYKRVDRTRKCFAFLCFWKFDGAVYIGFEVKNIEEFEFDSLKTQNLRIERKKWGANYLTKINGFFFVGHCLTFWDLYYLVLVVCFEFFKIWFDQEHIYNLSLRYAFDDSLKLRLLLYNHSKLRA